MLLDFYCLAILSYTMLDFKIESLLLNFIFLKVYNKDLYKKKLNKQSCIVLCSIFISGLDSDLIILLTNNYFF